MTRPRKQLMDYFDQLDEADAQARCQLPHQSKPVDLKAKAAASPNTGNDLPTAFVLRMRSIIGELRDLASECRPGICKLGLETMSQAMAQFAAQMTKGDQS